MMGNSGVLVASRVTNPSLAPSLARTQSRAQLITIRPSSPRPPRPGERLVGLPLRLLPLPLLPLPLLPLPLLPLLPLTPLLAEYR